MAVYSYYIGTTTSFKNVEDGFTVAINAPRGYFQEAAQFVKRTDQSVAGFGSPIARWTFDILTQAMVNELRTQCGISEGVYSSTVYFTVRRQDGTFSAYSGTLEWPADQMDKRNFNGRYLGLTLVFNSLTKLGDVLTDPTTGEAITTPNGEVLYA